MNSSQSDTTTLQKAEEDMPLGSLRRQHRALLSALATIMQKWSAASDKASMALETSHGEDCVRLEVMLDTLTNCIHDLLDAIEASEARPQAK